MSADLPPWRPLLRAARHREGRSPQARWLQLATVAADGSPRVRTLVFRGWAGGAALDLLTDGRSTKSAELRVQPQVELCWLLPKARCQFRLRGERQQLSPEAALAASQQHWQRLNPGARALWGWPQPGAPLEVGAPFPAELADGTPLPDAFELVRIEVKQVELLELTGHPHQRRRWRADQGWGKNGLTLEPSKSWSALAKAWRRSELQAQRPQMHRRVDLIRRRNLKGSLRQRDRDALGDTPLNP